MLISNKVQYTCHKTDTAKGEFDMLYLCARGVMKFCFDNWISLLGGGVEKTLRWPELVPKMKGQQ